MKKEGKLTYLRSYNNTSVGLMQVNERVWRGVYNPESLRWNCPYNARAGCEILETYLGRYAVPKMARSGPLDADTLARSLYAMYNGGPGQFERFLERHGSGSYWLTDRLFAEKYGWVKGGRWDEVAACLGRR